MLLLPIERVILVMTASLLVVSCAVLAARGVGFDLGSMLLCLTCGCGLVMLAQIYRFCERDKRLAHVLMAVGLFILFTLAGATFNYVFLPNPLAPIDPLLIRIDAALGYDWATFVTATARHPWLGIALNIVYGTSLVQLIFIHAWWAFSDRIERLHHLMLTGMTAALLSIIFWACFPSFGAKAYATLPDWVEASIPLAVTPAYGRELLRLAAEGPSIINPREMMGLIAFPSFHIVMACLAVVFAPRWWPARATLYALNLVMLPATLAQGGHHLVDIAGGMAVFALAYFVARSVLRRVTAVTAESPILAARWV